MDPPDGLWVLTRTAPGSDRGAGALVRVPLDAPEPVDASQLRVVSMPFASATVPFEAGSLARHPGSGDLYVTEARGHHLFRVTPEGHVTIFARGGNVLGDGRAVVFDAQGRLLVLDHAGRGAVADTATDPLRDLLEAGEPYQGPVVHWLRVDETLPLPRNLEYAGVVFPPPALRRRRVALPRYSSLAALGSGEVIASASNGVIDHLRPDGTIARLAQLSGAGALVTGGAGDALRARLSRRADRPRPRQRRGGTVRRGPDATGRPGRARRRRPGRGRGHRPPPSNLRSAPGGAVTGLRPSRACGTSELTGVIDPRLRESLA